MKDVQEILEKYLSDNGFDGLVQADGECGCCIAKELGGLNPCDETFLICKPAYMYPDRTGEYDFRMTTSKAKAVKENSK